MLTLFAAPVVLVSKFTANIMRKHGAARHLGWRQAGAVRTQRHGRTIGLLAAMS